MKNINAECPCTNYLYTVTWESEEEVEILYCPFYGVEIDEPIEDDQEEFDFE